MNVQLLLPTGHATER